MGTTVSKDTLKNKGTPKMSSTPADKKQCPEQDTGKIFSGHDKRGGQKNKEKKQQERPESGSEIKQNKVGNLNCFGTTSKTTNIADECGFSEPENIKEYSEFEPKKTEQTQSVAFEKQSKDYEDDNINGHTNNKETKVGKKKNSTANTVLQSDRNNDTDTSKDSEMEAKNETNDVQCGDVVTKDPKQENDAKCHSSQETGNASNAQVDDVGQCKGGDSNTNDGVSTDVDAQNMGNGAETNKHNVTETDFVDNHSTKSEDEFESSDRHANLERHSENNNASTAVEESPVTTKAPKESESKPQNNLLFYRNEIPSRPFPGAKIEEMLQWKGNYQALERGHSYIQWLFPLPEGPGLNFHAQKLYPYEAEAIIKEKELHERVLRAYEMMLDFYGLELADKHTGVVIRKEGDWKERFAHFNKSIHNHMRLTRIIASIGELGYDCFQAPLIQRMIYEVAVSKEMPDIGNRSIQYWIDAVTNEADRYTLIRHLYKTDEIKDIIDEQEKIKRNASHEGSQDENGIKSADIDIGAEKSKSNEPEQETKSTEHKEMKSEEIKLKNGKIENKDKDNACREQDKDGVIVDKEKSTIQEEHGRLDRKDAEAEENNEARKRREEVEGLDLEHSKNAGSAVQAENGHPVTIQTESGNTSTSL